VGEARQLEPILLSAAEAAELLGVCRRTFDRHVAPCLPRVSIGTRVRYDRGDLIRWLESRKVGPSDATPEPGSTRSGSGSRVVGLTARRAREIERKLSAAQRRSSKKR
jgi:predicted DNA-binding transcriptional regulator AlpA